MNSFPQWLLFGSLLTCLSLSSIGLKAQSPFALRFLPQEISAQAYQPAYLALAPAAKVAAGGHAGYALGSNVLNADLLFSEVRFLDEARKNQIIDRLGDDNRLAVRLHWDAHANVTVGKQRLSLSFAQKSLTRLAFHDPASMQLLLFGNAPFAGTTLEDENIQFVNRSYQEIAIGSAWKWNKLSFGTRLKGLLGQNNQTLSDLDFQLTTSELGTSISLNHQYDYFVAQEAGLDGWGLGLDLGVVYDWNEKLRLQASLLDVGFLTWSGNRYQQQGEIVYEGVEITNLINLDLDNTGNLVPTDTLQDLLIAGPSNETQPELLPIRLDIGASYQLTAADRLNLGLLWGLQPDASGAQVPIVSLGYQRQLGNFLQLGAHGYVGGVDTYGAGLFARGGWTIQEKIRLSVFASLDNGMGVLMPQNSGGLAMNGGLSFGWL
ncbi:MAG: DUF5723 family protein [Bacteroidota bacterium]